MEYKYTGIVLDKRDVAEIDRIYTFYTLESGKIKALAKSVRKPQSKMAGFLENFSLINLAVAKSQGVGKISSVILENNFSGLRKNLEALQETFWAMRLFQALVFWEGPEPKLFALLKEYLEILNELSDKKQNSKMGVFSCGFIFKVLEILGYKMEANQCVVGAHRLSQGVNYFSAEYGGAVCQRCAESLTGAVRLSENSIKLIRLFFKNSLSSLKKLRVEKKDQDGLKIVLQDFSNWLRQ